MPLNRMKFMNTYIDNVSRKEAIEYIESFINSGKIGYVITPNVDQIIKIEKNIYFKEICNNAELLLTDGHPLIWISKFYHKPIKEKICGSDFMLELCGICAKKGYSIFLLGAKPGVASTAAKKLKEKYHGLKVAGTYSPPFGFENNEKEIMNINQILLNSKADILFVGMGAPKQSIFIYENMNKYRIPISFSVGAAIDFAAGNVKRAPKWMSNHGFEWLFRITQDPKRMFKRYIIDDMKVFKLAWKYRREK